MQASGRIALILVLGAAAGCYRPAITNGGFHCADGGVCPEGFRCSATDNRCYSGDAGPEAATSCDALPTTFSVCSTPPASGAACNPACQTGCPCGKRCTVSANAAVCTSVGTKGLGDVCNLGADDCQTGLGCVKDGCGTNLGRCRKFCQTSAECTGGCNVLVGTTSVCEPPVQSCNPVAGSGCPDPALACFLEGTSTICDCPGDRQEGTQCTFSPDCAPGLTCIGFMGPAACHLVCTGNADCRGGQTCDKSLGGTFGFCHN